MSYFSKFPNYGYDLSDTQNRTLITDILRRVNMKGNARANTLVFDNYTVQDGDQPDMVAHKYMFSHMIYDTNTMVIPHYIGL